MRNLILVVVLCVIGGAAVFFLLGGDKSDPDAGGEGDGAGTLDRGGGEAPILYGSGEEGGLSGSGTSASGGGSDRIVFRKGESELRVRVKSDGAPAQATVELHGVMPIGEGGMGEALGRGPATFFDMMIGAGRRAALARKQTDENGEARFVDIGPGIYSVIASSEDGRSGSGGAQIPIDGARVATNVTLATGGHAFEGTVTFDDGTPFRGLLFVAPGVGRGPMGPMGPIQGSPVSIGPDGSFRTSGLPPGPVSVTALLPGALRVTDGGGHVPQSAPYVLKIPRSQDQQPGKVIDAVTREPIAGARIVGGQGSGDTAFQIFSTESDSKGEFMLPLTVGRGGGMFAMAEGYAPSQFEGDAIVAGAELLIPMTPAGTIRGRVVHADGGEVPAGVSVFLAGEDDFLAAFPLAVQTDAEGRFEFEHASPGPVRLFVSGKGLLSLPGETGIAPTHVVSGEVTEVELTAHPAGRVEGRVLDPEGEPVRGALVQAHAQNDMSQMMFRMAAMMMGARGANAVVSGPDGAFILDTLQPDSDVRITADIADYPPASVEDVRVAAGATGSVELRFDAGRFVELTLLSKETGEPIAGAQVMATIIGEDEDVPRMIAAALMQGGLQSDSRGVVRIGPLGEGGVQVNVQAPGHLAVQGEALELAGSGAEQKAELRLVAGAVVQGVVNLPEELPPANVRLRIRNEGRGPGNRWISERLSVSSDGSFRIDTLPAGSYKLSADGSVGSRRWRGEMSVEAPAEGLVFDLEELEPGADAAVVMILDPEGEPVPGGRIRVSTLSENSSSSASGSFTAGRHLIPRDSDGVRPDAEVWIEVWRLPDPRLGGGVFGPFPGDQTEIEIRLPLAQAIEGTVLDDSGAPLPGLTITATPVYESNGQRQTGRQSGTAAAGADGAFTLPGLGNGTYVVQVAVAGELIAPDPVEVPAGTQGVEFRVRRGLTTRITVLGPDGKGIAGVNVNASVRVEGEDEGRSWREHHALRRDAVTNADGIATLAGLHPDHEFTLRANHGEAAYLPQAIDPWRPTDTTLRMKTAYVVAGTVSSTTGEKIVSGTVYHRRTDAEEQSWNGAQISDGTFRITGLEPGHIDLVVAPEGGRISWHMIGDDGSAQVVRARVGDENVALSVDLGKGIRVRLTDPGGQRHIQVRLSWQGPHGGQTEQQMLSSEGTARFVQLDESQRYTVTLVNLEGGKYARESDISPGGAEVVLRPERGAKITGTVQGGDSGASLRNAGAQLQGPDYWLYAHIQADGSFEFEGLPPGDPVTLRVHMNHDGEQYVAEQEASSGDAVTLTLQRQG